MGLLRKTNKSPVGLVVSDGWLQMVGLAGHTDPDNGIGITPRKSTSLIPNAWPKAQCAHAHAI